MKGLRFLFLVMLMVISPTIVFTTQEEISSFKCDPDDYPIANRDKEMELALDGINLNVIDAIFFIALGPVALLFSIIVIFTFIKYKKMKEQPGDLFLMIAIAESILAIHWMVSASNYFRHPNDPPTTNGKFCQINAVFSLIAGALEFLYNLGFCLYLYMRIRSVLKNKTMPKWTFHILCLGSSILMVSIISGIGSLGKSLFGTCSIKAVSSLPFFGPIILAVYIFAAIFSTIYFNRHVPKDPKFDQIRNQFLNYYYKYINACIVIWTVQVICNILAIMNCYSLFSEKLAYVKTVGNIAKLATPVVLSIIRMNDPFLKPKVKRLFKKAKNRILLKKSSSSGEKNVKLSLEKQENDMNAPFLMNAPSFDNPNLNGSGALSESQEGEGLLNLITENMKRMLIYSMLSGILFDNNNENETPDGNKFQWKNNNFRKWKEFDPRDFLSEKVVQLSQKKLEEDLPDLANELNNQEYNANELTMVIYASNVFKEIIEMDKPMVDIESSLNLTLNKEQVKKASGADGGKSGEFFFFSYDNRIIMKTLNETELRVMTTLLMEYYKYFQKNPESMIAKIYGIYKFIQKGKENMPYNVMIMRNVSGFPRFCVERVFDMKGSTVAREVFKGKDPCDDELRKSTLKDMDFLRFESKIKIEKHFQNKLAETLAKDSRFFKDHGIMDYSLIVFKINKNAVEKKKFEMYGNLPTDCVYLEKFNSPLQSLRSTAEDGIYYHIGIIDYLQLWDIKKKIEKTSKKLIKLNKDLDVSAQDPERYSERFIVFLRSIIFE